MSLEAKHIFFRYPSQSSYLLEDLSLSLPPGERLALMAPSGYGKTTLAKLLSGYLTPHRGDILVDGSPLPGKGICPVQMIGQHPEEAVNPRWRMRQVLEEAGRLQQNVLEACGIREEWLQRFSRELSGGQLQRFCIARALLAEPKYLICDEVSTMLDGITQAGIWEVILKESKKRQMGILAITHKKSLAKKIASRIIEVSPHRWEGG